MEYVDGKTLSQRLEKEGRLPVAEAVQMIARLARAMSGAHLLNIIHRDLKAANVMIRDDGEPILMDFGLARREGDERIFPKSRLCGELVTLYGVTPG
jgi:eukaryotic-like serine/threonine-protein kinase